MEAFKEKGIKFRWFAENCYEFVLPSGKTLLIDPILPDPEKEPQWSSFASGYTPKDLERCDYVFITHTHGDHVASLREICDMFNPVMLIHEASVAMLAKDLDLPIRKIVAYTQPATYDFGDFKITTYPGTHVPTIGDLPYSKFAEMFNKDGMQATDSNLMGSCFNTNFLLEVPGGIRIAFIQGEYVPLTKSSFYKCRPTLLIRQLTLVDRFPEAFDALIECMEDTEAGLAAFMCHHHKNKNPQKTAAELNSAMEKKGGLSRMFVPVQGKQYTLRAAIEEV